MRDAAATMHNDTGVPTFLRGTPLSPRRLAESYERRLPHDTWDVASIPVGSYLELVSHAQAVVVEIETSIRHELVWTGMADSISVFCGEDRLSSIPVSALGGAVTVPLRADGEVYRLYLPEGLLARVTSIVALEGYITPAPRRRRWLAYGDSITQGWSATDPGLTYSAIIGRRCGLETWNFGFAGAARGEVLVAQHIAELEVDLISLAFGTNNWTAVPTGAAHLGAILTDFVTTIRSGHPATPIVVVSPILRPEAENIANVTGSSLAQMRSALETSALQLAAHDPVIRLVPGLSLVAEHQLADGLHPNDEGHREMANGIGAVVAELLATL